MKQITVQAVSLYIKILYHQNNFLDYETNPKSMYAPRLSMQQSLFSSETRIIRQH
jgi:hypothetical protein